MRKKIRLLLGLCLAGATAWLGTAWLLTPGLLAITSTRAVVNARILTLHSPIEGTVTTAPPPVGKAVAAGSTLLDVENPLVDDSHLEELKTEAAALAERVSALTAQQTALAELKSELAADARNYHAASVRRLESQVDEARAVAAAAEAFLKQRLYKKDQLNRLIGSNNVSQLEMVTGDLAVDAAQSRVAQARSVVQRLSRELDAVRDNSFAGLGTGRNDVPYSQQRAHEIALRQQDNAAHILEFSARSAQVQKQLQIEQNRVRRQSHVSLSAPIDGIVWRRPVASGSMVTRETDLLELLDASDIFLDALVDERYFGDVRPGDPVNVQLIGSHEQVRGVVKEVLGQVAIGEARFLAAEPLRPGRHEIHLLVVLEDLWPNADHFHPYHIGQPAKVRFTQVSVLSRLRDWISQ